jgi:hypothetical protein
VATGVGSMPGTDARAAIRSVREALATDGAVPHLAETPQRGPGADMIGRAMGLLIGVWPSWAVETTATGWRVADAAGREVRQARSYLTEDLDLLEELYDGWRGPLMLPLAGPWTLAAEVELRSGERMLRDPGAVRDLVESLAEAAANYARDVRHRVPEATPVLQLDEPALPTVLAGGVPTQSGAHRYRSVDRAVVRTALTAIVDRLAQEQVEVMVHCCASAVPYELLRESGVAGIGIDFRLLRQSEEQAFGECLDAGLRMGLGLRGVTDAVAAERRPDRTAARSDSQEGRPSDVTANVYDIQDLGYRLGFSQPQLVAGIAVSTPCGLVGDSPDEATAAMIRNRELGRVLREEEVRPDER